MQNASFPGDCERCTGNRHDVFVVLRLEYILWCIPPRVSLLALSNLQENEEKTFDEL